MAEHEPKFTVAEIEKIADLANLELTDAEKATFARQFGEILAYFEKIAEVDTSAVDTLPAEDTPAELREDRARPSGVSPEDFSPYLESGHFKVPRVIE